MRPPHSPYISVVAPVYNESAGTLNSLVDRLAKALGLISADYEIILVDDGSRNDAWQTISALSAARSSIKGIRLARNFGQHSAICAGLDHSSGEWVVVMDSDLQDRPEVIPDLHNKAKEGFDVVFVSRMARPDGFFYLFLAGIFYKVFNFLAGQEYQRSLGNFSIVHRDVADAFRQISDRNRFYGGTIRWLGFRQTSIIARHGERFSGKPSYSLRHRFRFAFQLILGYSTRLLYVAIVLGFIMAIVSFILAGDIIAYKIANPDRPVPGWPSVMTAVFFTAGMTNIMLGLIGFYMADLVQQSKHRPRYVIQRSVGDLPQRTTICAQSVYGPTV